MPTIVVFEPKDTTNEFDRDLGYKSPAQLLTWLNAVKGGKSPSAAVKEQAAAVVGKGGDKEVDARYKLAQKLSSGGQYTEATDQYVWLWNNILKECPAMAGVRSSFMASEMARLATDYPPAKRRFSELRTAALKSDDRRDWIVLNQMLDDEGETLKWFDQTKNETTEEQIFAPAAFVLQDLLIRNKRWADVALYLYKDPMKRLNHTYESAQKFKAFNKNYDPFPREAAALYTCLLAANEDDAADEIARKSMELQNTPQLRKLLVTTAFKAGYLKASQLKWLDDMPPSTGKNFYWERASLYCIVDDYARAIKDYDREIQAGHPNAALYCSRGYAHYKLDQDQLAMDDYNAAEALAPKSGWSWVNKSALYYHQKKYDDAYAAASKAIELDPKNMEGFCNRGEASLKLGHLADAVSDLSRAADSNTPSCTGEAHYYRAQAYIKLGKRDQAQKDAKTATALEFKPAAGE
jgi:tetratricopeptide (TPR) repeat protein